MSRVKKVNLMGQEQSVNSNVGVNYYVGQESSTTHDTYKIDSITYLLLQNFFN